MPETMSNERRSSSQAYGAELVLTPGSEGHAGRRREGGRRSSPTPPDAVLAQQFENAANPAIHRATTGPRSGTTPTAPSTSSSRGVGTGGTITGAGRRTSRSRSPSCRSSPSSPPSRRSSTAALPARTRSRASARTSSPTILDREVYDEVIDVNIDAVGRDGASPGRRGRDPRPASRRARPSTAALELAGAPENAGKTIVVIVASYGERYLSTVLYEDLARITLARLHFARVRRTSPRPDGVIPPLARGSRCCSPTSGLHALWGHRWSHTALVTHGLRLPADRLEPVHAFLHRRRDPSRRA